MSERRAASGDERGQEGAGQSRWLKAALGFVVLAFCAAPVPGDVGGCGQDPQALDPPTFFASIQYTECKQCGDCGIRSTACERACGSTLVQSDFPEDCAPLVHDGEVCLRALERASCGDFRDYMSDDAPTTPTECNFCPASGAP
jgi:hypothetical protein